MPHFIVEYAKELEAKLKPEALIESVYQASLDSSLFEADDIKIRLQSYEHHCTGEAKKHFVHVTTKLLSGRSLEQRASLSRLILSSLESLVTENISLTVEVCEIERASYSKVVK